MIQMPEPGRPAGVAFEFPESSSSPTVKLPKRIHKRLLETRSPPSAEEIEAKLREADLRRQQFHDWLSSKARPKSRSPPWFSHDESLSQRLEAKLNAAQQKRLSILMDAKIRLARLDQMRKAAKCGAKMRFEKERQELGFKVESRVQQAEMNRTRLLKALHLRKSVARERTAKSLSQKIVRDNRNKEHAYASLCQKWASAERRRFGLLEAEMMRARARVMQARRVARSVTHQREAERRRIKDHLEKKLQRAKRQRAVYLKQRGIAHLSSHINWNKHGDLLSRQLARCWKQFLRSRKTTFALANACKALGINEESVKLMPFEQLAVHIESDSTIQTMKALLERLESRFTLSHASTSMEKIDHLLKRLSASPKRTQNNAGQSGRARKVPERTILDANKSLRYPARVVLCAYMILAHPDAVFSGHGYQEVILAESALKFIQEFELLIKIILEGPVRSSVPGETFSRAMFYNCETQNSSPLPVPRAFRIQLAAFDVAWCSYLYCFVLWKDKDAVSLEKDLVRAACQLELSMMQKCRMTYGQESGNLTHDMMSIQKQVIEDQMLLREKVKYLSGDAGIERMESALSDTRSKFSEAKENLLSFTSPVAHFSHATPNIFPDSSPEEKDHVMDPPEKNHVVRCLFKGNTVLQKDSQAGASGLNLDDQISDFANEKSVENILLVNEILHKGLITSVDDLDECFGDLNGIKSKVKETMEKAFWDVILEPVSEGVQPDNGHIIRLLKEVQNELFKIAPQSWKQEIAENFDIDVFGEVMKSGACTDYLRRILEYASSALEKLSSPAKASELKEAQMKLLNELSDIAKSDSSSPSLFIVAIRGLRFVLEQIQTLRHEIGIARIKIMESFIKGAAGFEYLQKRFSELYGPPSNAISSLPCTLQWLDSVKKDFEGEWDEHIESLSSSHCLPPASAIRAGGAVPLASYEQQPHVGGDEHPECTGEKVDLLVRLGLLKLACNIKDVKDTIPETFALNVLRLRSVQEKIQKIIVISISILVLRQMLFGECSKLQPAVMEAVISDMVGGLWDLLDRAPDVGITTIVGMISSLLSLPKQNDSNDSMGMFKFKNDVMANMLVKCLRAEDAVFLKVAQSVYLAIRGMVLCGSPVRGQNQAEKALMRIGAIILIEKVAAAANILVKMAAISIHVHRPWYEVLLKT